MSWREATVAVRMTFKDFLDRVEGVYKSIDLRIAAVNPKSWPHIGIWGNALTVLRFSCMEIKDVETKHRQLVSTWGEVETTNFRIHLKALDFSRNLEDLLYKEFELFWGFSPEDRYRHNWSFGRSVDLLALKGNFSHYGYTGRESEPYPFFEAFEGERCSRLEEDSLQSEVKSKTLVDIYTLIRELLEVDFSRDLSCDLIINAPFYAAIQYVDFGEQRCKIQIKFHKDIKALGVSAIVRRGDHDNAPLRDKAHSIINLEESQEIDKNMRLWTKEIELLNATPGDYLWVNLMQTEPTALDVEKPSFPTQISRFLESKKSVKEPLSAAFRRFCTIDELEGYLTKPGEIQPPSPKKPSSAFEGVVLWILGLCGFSSIWLGWTEHETLKEGKIEHLRLDILARYEKENTLLLVACTTGRPDQDIDIVNSIKRKLYEELFKDTSIQIKGFIFSSQPSVDVAKQLGEKAGVTVFGADEIRGILNYIRRGDIPRALSDYFGFPFKPKMGE